MLNSAQHKSTMPGSSCMHENQTYVESTKLFNQDSVIPHYHQMNPHLGSSSVNKWTNYSTTKFVSATSSPSYSLLEAVTDEIHKGESLARAKILSHQLLHHVMNNEREENGGCLNMTTKTFGNKSSVYRGVTKYNDKRFEAYVYDNTIQGEKGKTVYIGGYSTEIQAAKAHDLASIKICGESTVTNFPVRCYRKEIQDMQSMSKRDYILAVRRRGKSFSNSEIMYRGVHRISEKRKWEARLGQEGLTAISLGVYYTAEDAARAYDIASIKLRGWDAITNFDLNSYDMEGIIESARVNVWGFSNPQTLKGGSNNKIQTHPPTKSNSTLSQYNVQQLNNSSYFHGNQNLNPTQSYPSTIDELFGSAVINGNSIGNFTGKFPMESATLQQSLQSHVNVKTDINQNILNKNQFLQQSSSLPFLVNGSHNLELQKSFGVPDMVNESPGATNGVCSSGLLSTDIHQVEQSDQEFQAALLQLTELDQSYNTYNYQNLNSCFSDIIQNPCSESNNNDGYQSQMAESLDDFDISDYLNDSFLEDSDFDGSLTAIIGD